MFVFVVLLLLLLLVMMVLLLVIFVVGGFSCIDDAVIVVVGGGGRLLLRLRTDMCNCLERQEGDISTKLFVNLSVSSLSLDYYQLLLFYIFIRPRYLGSDVWVRTSVRQ